MFIVASLAFLRCDDSTVDETDAVTGLTMSGVAGTWQTVESQFVVDSVVCGRQCYHASARWETLTLAATDSTWVRLRCSSASSEYVFAHSPDCGTVTMSQSPGSTDCSLDTGWWSITQDTLLVSQQSGTERYRGSLSGDGSALDLTDSTGTVTRYTRQGVQ